MYTTKVPKEIKSNYYATVCIFLCKTWQRDRFCKIKLCNVQYLIWWVLLCFHKKIHLFIYFMQLFYERCHDNMSPNEISWTMCPLDETPLAIASLRDVSRPWTAYGRWIIVTLLAETSITLGALRATRVKPKFRSPYPTYGHQFSLRKLDTANA
jgi:hypothetical protein